MEYLIMAYGRDFEPMAEIFCDSYMILEFYAMSTCWPNVHWSSVEYLGALATGWSNPPAAESAPPPDAMAKENPEGGTSKPPSPEVRTSPSY